MYAVSLYVTVLKQIEPAVTGDDLIKMGYHPGPQFKKILAFLDEVAESISELKIVGEKFLKKV